MRIAPSLIARCRCSEHQKQVQLGVIYRQPCLEHGLQGACGAGRLEGIEELHFGWFLPVGTL